MRRLPILAGLLFVGCISQVTATEPDARAGAYVLTSVDLDALPAAPEYSNSSRWVLGGSLTLQPDGYFVLFERDSVWNGRDFVREDHTQGGRWTSDGSLLTLSDTAAETTDPYGTPTTTQIGGISPHAVLLTIQSDDGTDSHIYQYKR